MKKYIFFITIVLIILFCVSSMSYEQQTIVPSLQNLLENRPFEQFLSQFEFTYWGMTISVESRGYFHFVEFLIRKGLHFFGFGLISILFLLLFRKLKWSFPTLISIGTTFIVACLDEYRQSFVEGRTGIFDDVLLDTAGAITLITLYKIYEMLKIFYNKKKVKKAK